MKLDGIMKREVVSVFPETTLDEAARLMKEHDVGCLVVADTDGKPLGILTDRDIVIKAIAAGKTPATATARDVMRAKIIVGHPDMDILEASRVMATNHIGRLPIQEDGRIVGIVSVTDIARIVQREVDYLLSLRAAPVLG